MVDVCFYFQVHQPYRLKKYSLFDIGKSQEYFDHEKNKEVFHKVTSKCYFPMNNLLLELLNKHPQFKVAFSLSGVFLEQCKEYNPELLESFRKLVRTGKVEILSETYYHSLAFLYSKKEFNEQVEEHKKLVQELFGVTPKVFRNTELIYNNELAKEVEKMGYEGILAEGADHILDWRSPNYVYHPKDTEKIKLLVKNYKLSDDVAFRFSNQAWSEWPLSTDRYVNWINNVNGNGNVVNLFMDYETFGEHQWEHTGIFEFMRTLPSKVLEHPDNNFVTPGEAVNRYKSVSDLDYPYDVSWADMERDVSAWRGNKMQESALSQIYMMQQEVLSTKNSALIHNWRKLQTSDLYYYMCTKYFNDGDVHKYFNPYDSPYEAFINFMNIVNDLTTRLKETKHLNNSIGLKDTIQT